MADNIRFFRRNRVDLANTDVETTVSDSSTNGGAVLSKLRDRSNDTFWVTETLAGATDVEVEYDLQDALTVDTFVVTLCQSNEISLEWSDDGVSWTFAVVAETNNANSSVGDDIDNEDVSGQTDIYYKIETQTRRYWRVTFHQLISTTARASQVVLTEELGQLEGYPIVRGNSFDRNLNNSKVLSGKRSITQSNGGYSFSTQVRVYNVEADLLLLESLFLTNQDFVVWLAAGESAIQIPLKGWRFEDLLTVKVTNSLDPVKYKGLYKSGYQNFRVDFAETI